MRDALQDESSGILVTTGGRFPCLHIGVSGLRQDRRYLLALDFCQITCDVDLRFLEFTEPYYMPRPNHLEGRQWMNQVLHFNLTSIANGGLQESDMTLKMNCEYEPTLRILEQRDDHLLSGTSAIRFTLKGSEFLVVSLTSEPRGAPRPSCMSTSGQLELNALFQRLQNTAARPIMEPCVPSYSVAAQNETRQPVAPFPSQPQDVDWSKRGSAALPTQRVNFDTVPSNYLRWVALARSNLARPAVDQCQPHLHLQYLQQLQLLHHLQQQERQQMRQEMGTQVGTQAATSENNDSELDSSAGMAGHSVTYFSP
ncbi:hypothetical protein IscW_ISCW006931 [Ixodes scapularis]|uniref:T-box domain-containing protein n=1 Tax=Ixodes scapularis TaxID=6945 RepID=B7PTN3_IXOSC|nr:hypothetical protein IscW_ISCW006931 [Ixodes scapularis]|eukprot:XP_002404729.1 hypothetical protein IscW_ISCW006931 [Ixodes scapularis]